MSGQKASINRAITKPIQLITQSYKHLFVASNQVRLDRFSEKTYHGPVKTYDLDEGGSLRQQMTLKDFLEATQRRNNEDTEKWLRQVNHYTTVQKVTIVTSDEKGVYMGAKDLETLPKQQYRILSRSLSDQDITRLMKDGFCDFFNARDITESQYYLEVFTGLKNPIHAANWFGLYRKISTLTSIIANATNGSSTDKDRQFLEAEVRENVCKIMVDRQSFAYRETQDADAKSRESDFLDSLATKQLGDKNLTEGYQIFGHIALCCLELLLELDRGLLPRYCKNPDCGKFLSVNTHGNQKTCSEKDNPQCYKSWRSRAKRIERSGIKTRKNRPRKPIPSRNYN